MLIQSDVRTAASGGAPAAAPPPIREELDELVVPLHHELRATALGVATRTVERDRVKARSLLRELLAS